MAYRNLKRHILELFVEVQSLPSRISPKRRTTAGIVRAKRIKPPKPERAPHIPMGPPPRFNQPVPRAPVLATCFKCGGGITSSDPRIVQAHVRACGVKQARLPQRR